MVETHIAHYRIIRQLGKGGMGEVSLAQDTELDRPVALKVMSAELARDAGQRKRFNTEARAASGLSHPNICVIHDVGETEDGRPFLAMEYVEGSPLDTVMQQRRLKIREILNIGIQAAEALAAAHARRIVHRDIKPANIMLDVRGNVKVLDFGLAKRFAEDSLSGATSQWTAVTQPGFLVGTPHYMSPEQALGREVDNRSDLFSLGVVLYELVAGQKPFLGKSVGETINNIINQPPEPLGLENPIYSPMLDGIIFKCLEKDPAKRYATARLLAEDLSKLKTEAERSSALIGRETPVSTPAPAIATAEPGKIWQLPGKAGRKSSPLIPIAAVAVVLLAIGGWAFFHERTGSSRQRAGSPSATPASSVQEKSVAVLPFDNFSAEKDADYLSDGLTEEITSALSRVPGLKVAARNSAFTFKGRKEDLRKVGAALGVATLLEGSLRKAGQQMRVTAQLVSAADGYHLWSETYDRSVNDIIGVQEEIARKIAERFELKIDRAAAPVSVLRREAPKPDVYALYLQGLHFWNKRTKEDLEKAAQFFNQAIDKDATYAPAYAGLASCYVLLPDYALRPVGEYLPLALAAAGKALELDASSADAHAVLGLAKCIAVDYKAAEQEYQKALQLNQNHATARHWYGILLRDTGRMEEAYQQLRQAEQLDPLSPIIKVNLTIWYGAARQYDRGIEECRQDLQAFPDFGLLRSQLAWFYQRKGMHKEAIEELSKARTNVTEGPYYLESLAYSYAKTGEEPRARKILAELEELKLRGYAVRVPISYVHLGFGELDLALDSLEQAAAAHETVAGVLSDPSYDELRPNPRFAALQQRLGLKK